MQSNTLTNKGLPDSYGRPNRDSFSVYRRIPEVEDLNRAKFTKTKSHEKPNQLKKLAIDWDHIGTDSLIAIYPPVTEIANDLQQDIMVYDYYGREASL